MKLRILHAYYGCETGCCGHIITFGEDVWADDQVGDFTFFHVEDKAEAISYLKENKEAILKYIPKECHDSLDWDSLDGLDSIVDWENCEFGDKCW